MFNKTGALILFAILLLLPISIAQTDYNESGFEAGNYDSNDIGFFNTALDPSIVAANSQQVGLSNAKQPALVSNLDNQGLKEIIILDSNAVRIFNRTSNSISPIQAVTVGDPADFFSNMITFDIDGDGLTEVIVANPIDGFIHILEYDGTNFVEQALVNMSQLTSFNTVGNSVTTASDVMIKCGGINSCMLAYTRTIDIPSAGLTTSLHAAFFNSTISSNAIEVDFIGVETSNFCFPKIKQIQFKDYDNDGDIEYIFSAIKVTVTSADDDLMVYRINVSSNGLVEEAQVTITELDQPHPNTAGDCRTDGVGNLFTSPLVQESGDGAEPETWVASMIDPDEFVIFKMEATDTNFDERFPDIADADGTLLSNVFSADAFADSDTGTEFCVFGQEDGQDRLDVLCASEVDRFGTGLNDELQFFLDDFSDVFGFNISNAANDWFIVTHSVDMSRDDDSNTDEILTSFGVFDLDNTGAVCSILGDCDLEVLYNNAEADGASIPVDYEDIGRVDIIHVTNTQLIYIDDLFTNTQVAQFCGEAGSITNSCSEYTINPCLDSTWRVNTSLTITVSPKDFDLDQVSARIVLYQGDDNAQDTGFTANASSGFTRSFSTPTDFLVNKTISNGNIQIQIRDTGNEQIRTLDRPFSVSTSGLVFGDCVTDSTIGLEEAAVTLVNATLLTDATENGLVLLLTPFIGLSGFAGTTIFLIVMLVISFGIWEEAGRRGLSANAVLGMLAIVNFLGLIIAARSGVIPISLIIIITVVVVAIIGVFLSRYLTGQQSNNAM